MASIFTPQAVAYQRFSDRKKKYLKSKTTDRKPVVKREQKIQIQYCQWLRDTFPGVHFRSDTGSGAFNSNYEKQTHNLQQSASELPDITIFAARRGWHALFIEMKAEGVNLKMKRDGTKVRVVKRNGKVVERDYKIRKKGDWASLHIEKQAKRIEELKAAGYFATFGQGLEHAKKITCWYFDVPYVKNLEMF